ncbi:acetate kinase [Winogradskyella epiphytica]|uniref:Acetate kinase n=1 Tax=Winogradskyella epiphytica TaxID=262005 RepID=A0A2V4WWL1_9FLAO|nr:acetate kinase [Winogradskyella epiphytica]PYE81620.1 acetate kinase [Winogradskyella epiphytica]GGW63853.1 acetate kinase [Winogradskyella epiphytica]
MNILIINSGSSSIKFQLIQMPSETMVCSGLVERVGHHDAILNYKKEGIDLKYTDHIESHKEGLQKVVDLLLDPDKGVIKNTDEIDAVGHRVVHGGNAFTDTTLVTEQVKQHIQDLCPLAPLHNPHNLEGILVAEKLFSSAKQVAVFDTAFLSTLPEKAKKYAIPNKLYEEQNIQVYGFHGTSHKYVSEKAIDYLKIQNSKIITIHLGNGCSMTAVQNGISIDHSLGFTPSNGLIMGTRSGDIDHGVIYYLANKLGYTMNEISHLLTKESGMLGLTGYSDLRDIQTEAERGNRDCILALEMNAYRIIKYIGAYSAAMNGLDSIVFTAGIGENSDVIRKLVCEDMSFFGIELDQNKNSLRSNELREVSTLNSKVKVLVIPTNEELEIAKQAFNLIS